MTLGIPITDTIALETATAARSDAGRVLDSSTNAAMSTSRAHPIPSQAKARHAKSTGPLARAANPAASPADDASTRTNSQLLDREIHGAPRRRSHVASPTHPAVDPCLRGASGFAKFARRFR